MKARFLVVSLITLLALLANGCQYAPAAEVFGIVWHDRNGDGVRAGEEGVANATVRLVSEGGESKITRTSELGAYEFSGLSSGEYYIQVDPPPGFAFTRKGEDSEVLHSHVDPQTGQSIRFNVSGGSGSLAGTKDQKNAGLVQSQVSQAPAGPTPTLTNTPTATPTLTSTPTATPTSTPEPVAYLLLYVTDSDGNDNIGVMNADGSDPSRLTDHPAPDADPVVDPQGKLNYVSARSGRYLIYDSDGNPLPPLDGADYYVYDDVPEQFEEFFGLLPAPHAPVKVALAPRPRGIHTLGALAVTVASTLVNFVAPQNQPGRPGLLIVSNRNDNTDIFYMRPDGTLKQLTTNPADEYCPGLSPTGRQIAYTSREFGAPEIVVMNSDGSDKLRLTDNSAVDACPRWSPDGTQIVFTTDRDGNAEVYVMNADGSNPRNLTNNAAEDFDPDYSPDGKWVAFGSTRDGNAEIYTMNADGKLPTRITDDPGTDRWPRWVPAQAAGNLKRLPIAAGSPSRATASFADDKGDALVCEPKTKIADPEGDLRHISAARDLQSGALEIQAWLGAPLQEDTYFVVEAYLRSSTNDTKRFLWQLRDGNFLVGELDVQTNQLTADSTAGTRSVDKVTTPQGLVIENRRGEGRVLFTIPQALQTSDVAQIVLRSFHGSNCDTAGAFRLPRRIGGTE